MGRQVRHRVTALVMGGLLIGALAVSGTANAEQVGAGGRQVVFGGGGMFGLSCRSQPDVESMTVPSDSTIRLVNRTGYSARLTLGGSTGGTVPDKGSTDVRFRRGTTAVLLSPNCPFGEESTPLLITASPSPAVPTPNPMPTFSPPPSPVTSNPPPTGTPSSPGATEPTRPPHTSKPRPTKTRTPKPNPVKPTRTTRPRPVATPTRTADVQNVPTPKTRTTTRGTPTATPTPTGTPPGDDPTPAPGVPTVDLSEAGAAPDAPTTTGPDAVAAEQVASLEPIQQQNRIGLLAAIAVVFVLGVGYAAIRAFVSERASRATIA